MGDVNQHTLVARIADQLEGPFLEVGSKNYGTTQDLRSLLSPQGEYVGVDMEDGKGVDLVVNLTRSFDNIDATLHGKRFGTIICLSVLEHCDQPFLMAENMTRLLRAGGRIVVCAPFVWKFHGYPSDYWRFTHEGIKKLFPKLTFEMDNSVSATQTNVFLPLDENLGKISFSAKTHRKQGHFLRGVVAGSMKLLARMGPMNWLAGCRYVMPPTNVFMTGTLTSRKML